MHRLRNHPEGIAEAVGSVRDTLDGGCGVRAASGSIQNGVVGNRGATELRTHGRSGFRREFRLAHTRRDPHIIGVVLLVSIRAKFPTNVIREGR